MNDRVDEPAGEADIDPRLWRPLFDAVYEMNVARGHADFTAAVLAALGRLLPADLINIHVLDRASGRLLHRSAPDNPFTPEETAHYVAHPEDNPWVAYYARTGDRRARRISDIVPMAEWRRSRHYQTCLRRLGLLYGVCLPITVDETTVAGLALIRRRADFTSRHCALLDAFAPHFLLAWRRHGDPWRTEPNPRPSPRERLQAAGLTAREADVLLLMTEGHQNREIATILGRSLHTIQEHVGNIVRKLDQDSRHGATVFALKHLLGS
ncbi:MAG: LuxR C-terminal-related transcriptional regulator [Vicinamibacterales bacterium]|nr:LuxR C-terminal-related transcriptional regulator [Vicinamibacterales bacterium]